MVDWKYTAIGVTKLADPAQIKDIHLYPGVSCSEHMFNKTMIAFKRYKADQRNPKDSATPIMQIDIRTHAVVTWCDKDDCKGTMPYDVPFAAIFNREPRIPLTLAAPSLVSARFTIEAGSPSVSNAVLALP